MHRSQLPLFFSCWDFRFIFRVTFKGNYRTMPTTGAKKKRRGSVALTGLSDGEHPRRTRHRLLMFSLAQTTKKK